jgi:hypothetical protein
MKHPSLEHRCPTNKVALILWSSTTGDILTQMLCAWGILE